MQSHFTQQYDHRRKFRIRIYFGAAIVILLFLLILYIILYSPIFQIKKFEVSGSERIGNEEVMHLVRPLALANRIKNFLGTKNLLVWEKGELDVSKTALLEAHVSRDWLRQAVHIEVQERKRFAIWCDAHSNCYWIDEGGIMFEESPTVEGSLILTVIDESENIAIKGGVIPGDQFAKNIIALVRHAPALELPIQKITFHKKLQELRIRTYRGPDVYFSIRLDPLPSIESLKALREKVDFNELQYIDLRVENRIYYK